MKDQVTYGSIKSLWVVLPLLIGTGVAIYLTPILFKEFPSDFSRTNLIIKTLNKSEKKPDIALFGSSILMAGVDAKLLSLSLEENPLIYNFASTGQLLTESALYYQSIDTTYKAVFQFLRIDQLMEFQMSSTATFRNFKMFGYEKKAETEKLLPFKETKELDKSRIQISVDGRNVLVNFINRSARSFLRKDLNLEKINTELFYPNTYTKRVNRDAYEKLIEKYNPENPISNFKMAEESLSLLKRLADNLSKKGVKYYIVINPINPDLKNYTEKLKIQLEKELKELKYENLNFINMATVLNFIFLLRRKKTNP